MNIVSDPVSVRFLVRVLSYLAALDFDPKVLAHEPSDINRHAQPAMLFTTHGNFAEPA